MHECEKYWFNKLVCKKSVQKDLKIMLVSDKTVLMKSCFFVISEAMLLSFGSLYHIEQKAS